MKLIVAITAVVLFIACDNADKLKEKGLIIGSGQMPNLAKDTKNNLHIVYGTGDSIMFSSSPNGGKTFSSPALIAVLPKLAASHMRGPQIAATLEGLTVIACNSSGDIFSYTADETGKWIQTARVNDVDTIAKE